MNNHPFDKALELQPAGSGQPGTWLGASSPAYWNMVGPFGGITAATAVQAVMRHPDRLGEPIALTVNYAAALGPGPFTVQATPVRTNRSTQHWTLLLSQPDGQGADAVVMSATAVTAARRQTWSANDTPMPATPAPSEVAPRVFAVGLEWLRRYEMRLVEGMVPEVWDGGGNDSLTRLWVRDEPPRPLDFPALAAMADVFYPRVWLRRATHVPAGTVSITTYFHADSGQLAQTGEGFLLGQARAQAFRNGFFDQTAHIWSEAGALLATSHQMVYYKE